MTDSPDDRLERVFALIANYVRPGADIAETSAAIPKVLAAAAGGYDPGDVGRMAGDLADAQDETERATLVERITAAVARGILRVATEAQNPPDPEATSRWIKLNVMATPRHAFRVKAIWRVAMGLPDGIDDDIHDHALKSALSGATIQPVPGAAPSDTPTPGTEDKMLDPTKIRERLLEGLAFNPAGLPPGLRKPENQQIYLDAVAQSVILQLHLGDGDDDTAGLWSASVAGLLLNDGNFDPRDQRFFQHAQRAIVELGGSAVEDGTIAIDGHKVNMFAPDRETTQRIAIYGQTLEILARVASRGSKIFIQSFAHVARNMASRYPDHQGDPTVLGEMVKANYNLHVSEIASGNGGGGGGIANVELPPLNDPQGFNDEIEPDNIRAVSAIYVTYQLEFGLKAAARILDLFVAGLLPISASEGSAREIDNLYWDQDDFLDEASRRSVYSRVLGAPGGEIAFDIQPNTEFNTLLMRVVSAVSEFEREQSVLTHFDNAARGRRFQSTSGEFVRKAIRDFAANASLRGWAGTAFTAERMARHLRRVMNILSMPAVRNAFGVTTPWQVIERVSQREFGVTVNTVLHRTLAVETQTIMRIIADHHTIWSNNLGRPLFPEPGARESDLSPEVTRELMVACQHFRAVTGVGDALLDEYSEPVETKPMPSLPDMSGFGGMGAAGGMAGIDLGGIGQLRDMVASGQSPSLEQLRAMLPGL